MSAPAKTERDVFRFSLGGVASLNSYALVPAIPDDQFDKMPEHQRRPPAGPGLFVVALENTLARYFAPGC